jgi:GWxTD domain-containing protein
MTDIVPWLVPLWIVGVLLFNLRAAASWLAAHRLRTKGVCLAPEIWQHRIQELANHLGIAKAALLLESSLAGGPAVVGFIRPVILTPVGMLAGMPTAQIESILLHELAHIRRRDYLANLLQTAVEGLLFYHPAVWWVSHVIRAEREYCCDDLVVNTNGNARDYAAALSALAENRLALTVALPANGGSLMKRIRRLLYPEQSSPSFLMPVLSAAVFTLVTAWAATAWQAAAADAPKPPEAPQLNHFDRLPRFVQTRSGEIAQVEAPPVHIPPAVPQTAEPPAADAYTRWQNEDVVYIITDAERSAFRQLQTDEERKMFVEQFWLRRDPTPGTPNNEMQEEHYRRIAYANDRFMSRSGVEGWRTDRGRIYISFGPPDEIDGHPTGSDVKPPFEVWRYRFIQGIGRDVAMEFDDTTRNGEYHMTMDPNEPAGVLAQSPPRGFPQQP